MRVAADPREFLQDPPLLGRERRRHLHVDPDELVSVAAAAQRGHAPVAQAEGRCALRAGRYLEARLARERRHLDRAAKRRQGELDGDLAEEIVPLALKELVLLHRQDDVQVPGGSPGRGRLAVAGGAQP